MIVVERTWEDQRALERCGYNPRELADDCFDWTGVVVAKPWGREVQLHKGGAVALTRLELQPQGSTSLHCHPGKTTQLIVESGEPVLWTLSRYINLRPGDVVHIAAGAFHRTEARGGCVLLEVESPPNKRDLVRIADRYGREGLGYEKQSA